MKGEVRRRIACQLAAQVMEGRGNEDTVMPRLWSLCVFFEEYIGTGAAGTRRDFGPARPTRLKVVKTKGQP